MEIIEVKGIEKSNINNQIITVIKYKLICKNCDLLFDSWFASSKEYEKLKNKKLLSCHVCNSKKVEKTLMAPKLLKKDSYTNDNGLVKIKEISRKVKEYQNFIKNNFEYVGKKVLKDKKWSKEITEYDIEVDGVKFKNLTKEQYELLYKLKGST